MSTNTPTAPTPLTDAAKLRCGFQAVPFEFEHFARSLERDNARLREALKIVADAIDRYGRHDLDFNQEEEGLIRAALTPEAKR